ncbi:MAG: response regulator [Verrucomicrobiota bacterium]
MKRILVIDDDKKIREIFERFLGDHGYAVICAKDGIDGLRLLRTESPDLVVTDIMMPNTDGLEVVLAMRDEFPAIPVIAISGGMSASSMNFLPLAKKFGACRILYKPVELDGFLSAVKEVLGK